MDRLLNIARREAERVLSRLARPKTGIVTSYDPANYAAKVRLQPEDVELGWLPVRTPWSGNGWGLFCPPSPGDEVEIQFQEAGKQAPYIALRAFGDRSRPLPVPSGEFWVVHKSGSRLKFLNDGTVEMDAPTSINVVTPEFNLTGDLNVTGDIRASGDIADLNDGSGSLNALRAAYDLHRHGNVQNGGGVSDTTDHPV